MDDENDGLPLPTWIRANSPKATS